jgi:hypothetical protein
MQSSVDDFLYRPETGSHMETLSPAARLLAMTEDYIETLEKDALALRLLAKALRCPVLHHAKLVLGLACLQNTQQMKKRFSSQREALAEQFGKAWAAALKQEDTATVQDLFEALQALAQLGMRGTAAENDYEAAQRDLEQAKQEVERRPPLRN